MDGNRIHRMTKQRRVIMEELKNSTSHPTAEEIYHLARRRLPNLSLGTVYRNLEVLVRIGLARKMDSGKGKARFDGDISQHYHFRCIHCGSIEDVRGVKLLEIHPETQSGGSFKVLGYNVEFYGICRNCKNDINNKSKTKLKSEVS